MTTSSEPENPPAPIASLLENMRGTPADSNIDCQKAMPAIDWCYRTCWQEDKITRDELQWLLDWMRHCDDPRRFEIGDGLCVTLLGEGRPEDAAALARPLLGEHPDPGLRHTLALATAATGDRRGAVEQLASLVSTAEFDELPPEMATQVLLDLATLHQQQGTLFQAIPSLTRAVEIAARSTDTEMLLEAARALIDQLVEQGGGDEAVRLIAAHLTDQRLELWKLVLARLARHLDASLRERGMGLLVAAGEHHAALNLLVEEAAIDPDRLLLAFTGALALEAPAEVTCPLAARLLASEEARRQEDAPLIAAASVAVAETQQEKSVSQAKWHRDGVVQLISVARHHGVPEHTVKRWAEDEGLYHEHGVIDRAARHCLSKIPDPPEWLRRSIEH